jgi:hypothetical protein
MPVAATAAVEKQHSLYPIGLFPALYLVKPSHCSTKNFISSLVVL